MPIGWFFLSLALTIVGAGFALYGGFQWLSHVNNPKAEAADTMNMFIKFAVAGAGVFLVFGIASVSIYLGGLGAAVYTTPAFSDNIANPSLQIVGNLLKMFATGTK